MSLIGKKVTGATCGCDIDWRKITGKITYAYQNGDKTYVNVAWSEEIANRFYGRTNLVLGDDVLIK